MYVLKNTINTILHGIEGNPVQAFPGKIFVAKKTLAKGTYLVLNTIVKWTSPVDESDPSFILIHKFDGEPVMQTVILDDGLFNNGSSPGLFPFTSVLFVGNDGNLYNLGKYPLPDDFDSATTNLFGAARFVGLNAPMGPIDDTKLEFTGPGASELTPFDFRTEGHEFTVECQIDIANDTTVDPALYSAELLLSTLEVYQGIDGNTSPQ